MPDDRTLSIIQQHFDTLIEHGRDTYGSESTPMWMSALDLESLRYPDEPLPQSGRRAYRDIHAPHGCNLYMDMPQLVAAVNLSMLIENPSIARAAQIYAEAYIERCSADNGLFLWGHHFYYDAFEDKPVAFHGARLDGFKHEMRPHGPAWELLYQLHADATIAELQALKLHFNPDSGAFDRHALPPHGLVGDQTNCAFLEAGAVLVSSLAWLSRQCDDRDALDSALTIARWSFEHRDHVTGLLRNNPGHVRWDYNVCTSEIGVWAGHLCEAYNCTGNKAFLDMADQALSAWLQYAWDEDARRYRGMVKVRDGSHMREITTDYQPREWSDIWYARFPGHDYPLHCAYTCVTMFDLTQKDIYLDAIERWAQVMSDSPMPARCREGHGAYAEVFGRGIRFLNHAARVTENQDCATLARRCADTAIDLLWSGRMFRGHQGEDRYEASDGVGWLLLGLLELSSGEQLQMYDLFG